MGWDYETKHINLHSNDYIMQRNIRVMRVLADVVCCRKVVYMTDFDNTRRARQEKFVQPSAKRKTRIVFLDCTKCRYGWGQEIYIDSEPKKICPKCGGQATEH